jgi:hypothetical protein
LSEGQLQDCEDVTKAELDNVVEYDASDSWTFQVRCTICPMHGI